MAEEAKKITELDEPKPPLVAQAMPVSLGSPLAIGITSKGGAQSTPQPSCRPQVGAGENGAVDEDEESWKPILLDDASSLPEPLRPLFNEIVAYARELPRLLAGNGQGKVALVHGGAVVNTWDTVADAYQHGLLQFGTDPFLTQPIDTRDLRRLQLPDGPGQTKKA